MARRGNQEINAGSMADIAFLLLIFFLVTTTMDVDSGIARKLPEKSQETPEVIIKDKNILDIVVNRNNQILVEGDRNVQVEDIRQIAIDFIDNGAGISQPRDGNPGTPCDYCNGAKDPESSDHPTKAVISLQSSRGTKYGMYVSIQNEIEGAYNELRSRYALKTWNISYRDLLKEYKNNQTQTLKDRIDLVKELYPQIISEPEPIK
jgi:hypothetical protein